MQQIPIFVDNATVHSVIATDREISLRYRAEDDDAFLRRLYFLVRSTEMNALGWDQLQIEAFLTMQFNLRDQAYRMQFPGSEEFVIELNGEPAGQFILDRRPTEHHIIDISIHPEQQNQGLGSAIVEWILGEAASAQKPVELKVDQGNAAARRFYERYGFKVSSHTELFYLMRGWGKMVEP